MSREEFITTKVCGCIAKCRDGFRARLPNRSQQGKEAVHRKNRMADEPHGQPSVPRKPESPQVRNVDFFWTSLLKKSILSNNHAEAVLTDRNR